MAEYLRNAGIDFASCDDLYESHTDFLELYKAIAERAQGFDVFAVPGHPMVGEESVRILAQLTEIQVLPAQSFVDAVLGAIGEPFSGALQIWNAHDPSGHLPDPRASQLVYQVDSQAAASDAKLLLLKFFPHDHNVTLISGAGTTMQRIERLPLVEVDRSTYDPLTTLYCSPLALERPAGFYGLVDIVNRLLGPGGCPWDREQTHDSLKKHMLEETYETLEAIDSGDADKLCEELGDFLLQAVMHAQMDAIEGLYDIDEVIQTISDKLVRRHPHVFGDKQVADADEVLQNWDAIKQTEKRDSKPSILDGVPKSLPALLRAYETSKRAVRVGFEWERIDDVFSKLQEETKELQQAIGTGDHDRIRSEIGDVLFTITNIARWLKVDPEDALRMMVERFTRRFQQMEAWADKPLRELTFQEWDALWERAKAATQP